MISVSRKSWFGRVIASLFACLCGLLCAAHAWALDPTRGIAQFHHTSWTTKDGLPANIWAITQTRDGYLWLGSVNGLYKFDGIKVERVAANVLPSPSIHALAAAPGDGLWIGYERPVGVISFLRDGVVKNFPISAPSSTSVHSIVLGPNHTVWAATPDTILRFDGETWQAIESDWGSSLGGSGGGVWAFGVARDGVVWSKNLNGLFYFKPGASRFIQAKGYRGGPEGFTTTTDGRLWTTDAVTRKLYVLPDLDETGDGTPPAAGLGVDVPDALGGPLLLDRDQSLWCTSLNSGGICRIPELGALAAKGQDPGIERLSQFTRSDGLSSNLIHTLFEDRESNIWVGTSLGLDRFRPANVVTAVGVPVGFRARFVQATSKALYAYTGWSNTATRATDGSESLYRILPGRAPEELIRNVGRLRDMFVNPDDGAMWLVTSRGVQRLTEEGRLLPPLPLPDHVEGYQVYSAVQDKSGAFWISAFHHGVFRQQAKGWERVDVRSEFAATAVLIPDPSGGMWVRYSGGSLFRVSGREIEDFSQRGLDIGDITFIKPDAPGFIIGGESGIARFDGNRFYSLRAADVPALSVVTGIARTTDGNVWIFTQAGILRIPKSNLDLALKTSDPSVLQFDVLESRDGLPGAAYGAAYGSTVAAGPDGRVWFTSGNGLAWIDPNNLYRNTLPPPVAIRALTAGDRQYAAAGEVSLPADTSNIQIDYTALSLSTPERIDFRYKLDGVDKDWIEAGNRRQAFYTRLSPGVYQFRVIASNNDGVWNTDGATLNFSIPPTFLQSRAFVFLCGFLVAGILWLVYRARLAQVSGRLRVQHETRLLERERIARELHDTLLQGFQGLMLRFQSVADSIPDDQPARQLIEQAMSRGDDVLAEGRDRVHDLRRSVTSEDLPKALRDAANDFIRDSAIAFNVAVEGPPCMLHPVICDEITRICTEAVLNAFQHSGGSRIDVLINFQRAKLSVEVRDDGVGIDPKVLQVGGRPGHFGLAGMRERARKIGAAIKIQQAGGVGTKVSIEVPAHVAYVGRPQGLSRLWRFMRSERNQ